MRKYNCIVKYVDLTLEERVEILESSFRSLQNTLISDKYLIGDHADKLRNIEGFISFVEKFMDEQKEKNK